MPYAHLVRPGKSLNLSALDPNAIAGMNKEEGLARLQQLGARIQHLQELLFAAGKNSLLIILQGRDTSGKDGAIRRLSGFVNVQSTRVAPFKVPTEEELAHDFLWRIHRQTPAKGEITIFNRSHYEDVLVVRVHKLVPEPVWKSRFQHINAFEQLLVDSGTILLKFYLHIDKDEQEKRLLEREGEPEKAWKLSVNDWKERELWGSYTKAYEDALTQCSSKDAPWFVVPANQKWYRDLAIAEAVVNALEPYEAAWRESLAALGSRQRKELEAYRSGTREGG